MLYRLWCSEIGYVEDTCGEMYLSDKINMFIYLYIHIYIHTHIHKHMHIHNHGNKLH